jgi:hypothetical protein
MTDLEILRTDLAAARMPTPRRRVTFIIVAVAVTITAAAVAANHYLGQPAPVYVNATFAQIVKGSYHPAPLKLDAARVVALSPSAVLYGANAADGSYCTELVTHGGTTYSVGCGDVRPAQTLVLYQLVPFHGRAGHIPPYVVAGRLSQLGERLAARFPDGSTEEVPIGIHGSFLFESRYQAGVRRGDAVLIERDREGRITNHVPVPPQIVVDPVGSPVRHIAGVITARRARYAEIELWTVELHVDGCRKCTSRRLFAQSGYVKVIPLRKDGGFSFTTPPQKTTEWFLSLNVLDARYFPLGDVTTGISIPDPSFWTRARIEAARR